jgi:hypothetical protein
MTVEPNKGHFVSILCRSNPSEGLFTTSPRDGNQRRVREKSGDSRTWTPEQFEQSLSKTTSLATATMSFFRHEEIYRPDEGLAEREEL